MMNVIGLVKTAYQHQTPTQVLVGVAFSPPCRTNTSPEFKGIKTALSMLDAVTLEQIPALNSKGLRPIAALHWSIRVNKYQP